MDGRKDTAIEAVLEHLIEHGPGDIATVFGRAFELAMQIERERFLREAGAAGRMSSHPGIVTVHDAGILDDDRPYLVMDLCPGGSLTRYLQPDHRLGPEQVREIGVRIADALAATHERDVLHRDVKPANILVDAYGNAGLADFGLAALPGPRNPGRSGQLPGRLRG